jgi:NAD(P)-dependent dehydrogenase (short-subunit alcohol dehydrogenase family)
MTQIFSERVCVVTGGTRGIGRAIAAMLLREGAAVAICGRDEAAVARAVEELHAETGGKVKGKAADVRDHEQVAELFRFVDAHWGALDVLVNNAGVGVFRPITELSIEDWRSTVETNLYGAFYASREALFRFQGRKGGYIVNMSSLAGAHAFAGGAAYNASKFGLTGLSEAMMQDVRNADVRVSYVMPGSVATEFGGRISPGGPEAAGKDPAAGGSAAPGAGAAPGRDWRIWPEDVAGIVRMLLAMPERTLISRVEVRPARPAGPAK